MEVINTIDMLMSLIDWLIPQSQAFLTIMTSKQMQRRVRAIVLFLSVLLILSLVGIAKASQIALQAALQEFESALQDQTSVEISNAEENQGLALTEISNSQNTDDLEFTPAIAVVRDMRIRSLRKEASQQGIRNVSRMTKAELMAALQIPVPTE